MHFLLLVLLAVGATAMPRSATASPASPLTVVDLATEFVTFYDATQRMEPAERVAALKAHFGARFPGFYDVERVRRFTTPERYYAQIARSLATFEELRPRFERITRSFTAMLEPAHADFTRVFPDLAPLGSLYLLHSMGEMDGGIRTIGGQRFLVFGADVMARLYAPGDERPFFQHELFHVYHRQSFDGCEAVWCALWAEGLAVYASERLNPGATDAQLLLTAPRPIRPEVEARRDVAICAVRTRFASQARDDYAPLFMGGTSLDGLPPRFGYYVGYLVAREAARTRSLQDLARLSTAEARPVVEAALAALAECPPAEASRGPSAPGGK